MIKDSDKIVWIILNIVKDLKVGKHKLAEFLKGSKAKDVAHLSGRQGYGGLLWYDIQTIIGFIEQLEQMGFLTRIKTATDDYYSIFELTDAGKKVIEQKIDVPLQIVKKEKPLNIGDSEKITLELFKKGKNIEEMAKERGLVISTIYDHLYRLILNKHISSYDFIAEKTITLVLDAYKKFPEQPRLKELKEMLPEEITYGEIRCVLADKRIVNGNYNE